MNIKWIALISTILSIAHCEQLDVFLPKHGLPPAGPASRKAKMPHSGAIPVKLDHFDPQNNKSFLMTYLFNGQFFKPNGPIFIMLGGEWTITADWLQWGQMFDLAEQTNAVMIYTQHRFYGNFVPDNDLSVSNLKYLTVDQALEDLAQLVRYYKTIPEFKDSKVIVFGGSYAGNLATWMRQKYPELIHAAVSSSAPLLAKVDFEEYQQVIQSVLGKNCSGVITRAIDQILKQLATPQGILRLRRDFNLCQPIDTTSKLDITYLFSIISTHFSNAVQYSMCGDIEAKCNVLMSPTNLDDYTKLATYLNQTFKPDCLPNYQVLKQHLSSPVPVVANSRQWVYQSCTQFGYFQTTTSPNQPYKNTLPLKMFQIWCQEFFNSSFTPSVIQTGVNKTNLRYGGLNPNITRVVSVHGTNDPWHILGLKENLNPSAPVIIVNGSSHCQDLYPISDCDSLELKNAKLTVQQYVKQWLLQD